MIISTERTSSEFLKLNSCAKQCFSEEHKILRENGRKDWHILYITKGCCYIEENGCFKAVEKGNIILYRPFERQSYKFPKGSESCSYYIHFCGRGCEEILDKAGITQKITYVGFGGALDNLFSKLCEEYAVKKPFYDEVCSGLLYELFMQSGRYAYYCKNKLNNNAINGMDKICKMMYDEISQNKSVAYYAKMCCLSTDRFSHAFKECTGVSPKTYIQNLKVSISCELLANTSLSEREIAEGVGISDVNYFCRMIKKHTGKTPLYFRK